MNNIFIIILINIALLAIIIFWINLNFEKKNSETNKNTISEINELKIGEAVLKWNSTNKKLVLTTTNNKTYEWL